MKYPDAVEQMRETYQKAATHNPMKKDYQRIYLGQLLQHFVKWIFDSQHFVRGFPEGQAGGKYMRVHMKAPVSKDKQHDVRDKTQIVRHLKKGSVVEVLEEGHWPDEEHLKQVPAASAETPIRRVRVHDGWVNVIADDGKTVLSDTTSATGLLLRLLQVKPNMWFQYSKYDETRRREKMAWAVGSSDYKFISL